MNRKHRAVAAAATTVLGLAILAAGAAPIKIDGSFSDWNMVPPIAKDACESLSPCDWREAQAPHDQLNWYIRYTCENDIEASFGAAYNIYVDTDRKRTTGYRGGTDEFPIGAEYLLQGGHLFVYDGDGTSWVWVKKVTLPYSIEGKSAEVSVPLAMIGNPDQVFFFFFGDNYAIDQSIDDTCPDNALEATGAGPSLRYSFIGE